MYIHKMDWKLHSLDICVNATNKTKYTLDYLFFFTPFMALNQLMFNKFEMKQ